MKKLSLNKLWFGAAVLALAVAGCQQNEEFAPDQEVVQNGDLLEGHFIVKYKDSPFANGRMSFQNYDQAVSSINNYSVNFLRSNDIEDAKITHNYVGDFAGFAANLTPSDVEALRKNPQVEYIEQDRVWVLDFDLDDARTKEVGIAAQSTPWGITRVGGAGNGTGKRAWVIDTGVDINLSGSTWVGHTDLNVNVNGSRAYLNAGSVYTMPASATTIDDGHGHGTHVAGTIAAKNNTNGVVGVAAGATVVGIKVLSNSGSGYTSDIVAGCNYVANNGTAGDVANLSLGGGASTSTDNAVKAIAAKGIKVAVAAGNSNADASNYSPARANATNLFTVASFAQGDVWSSFSNYGSPVDYAEPGSSIPSLYKDNGTATMSGTSMASPHLAGILLMGTVKNGGSVTRPASGGVSAKTYKIGKR